MVLRHVLASGKSIHLVLQRRRQVWGIIHHYLSLSLFRCSSIIIERITGCGRRVKNVATQARVAKERSSVPSTRSPGWGCSEETDSRVESSKRDEARRGEARRDEAGEEKKRERERNRGVNG